MPPEDTLLKMILPGTIESPSFRYCSGQLRFRRAVRSLWSAVFIVTGYRCKRDPTLGSQQHTFYPSARKHIPSAADGSGAGDDDDDGDDQMSFRDLDYGIAELCCRRTFQREAPCLPFAMS